MDYDSNDCNSGYNPCCSQWTSCIHLEFDKNKDNNIQKFEIFTILQTKIEAFIVEEYFILKKLNIIKIWYLKILMKKWTF